MIKKNIWQPDATIFNLKQRALIIRKIRSFFHSRNILEVETPIMSNRTVTDVNISSFYTKIFMKKKSKNKKFYLITSPEYHMKRLLAYGMGPIYQICKCFRKEEIGYYHNQEFTMLEWYRPGFDIFHLMKEVNDLIKEILKCSDGKMISYKKVFNKFLNIDPLSIKKEELIKITHKLGLKYILQNNESKDSILQLLFMLKIEPYIGKYQPCFIYHFPKNQAALSKINDKDKRISERFELYFKKIELANGFDELTDSIEQKNRFNQENHKRLKAGLTQQKIDTYFLNSLNNMPQCSGVALGIDRLIMLSLKSKNIKNVLSFSVKKC